MSERLILVCMLVMLISSESPGQDTSSPAAKDQPQYRGPNVLKDEPAITLVDQAARPAPVYYSANAEGQEKLAAEQLAKYLSQISGADFTATKATSALPDRAILVGEFDMTLPADLSREGFVIRTKGQRVQLCGGSPRATLYAVYCLLEEQLGCRWWSFNEETVPSSAVIKVAAQNTHIEPAFRIHDLFNREGQTTTNQFAFKRRGASGTRFTSVHNLCPMLKPYAEQHPAFLPVNKDGDRKFNNVHMNYTAAGMSEIVAQELSKQVVRHKNNMQDYFYFAGMGDWYGGMDLSPESQRVYEEEAWVDPDGRKKPGFCATMLRMVNRAAELLEEQHPGVIVGTHAYMSLEAPPAKTRPRSNVIVEIPRLRHDTVRGIEESPDNQSFRRNLDRWTELAPGRVYIWEYGTNFNNFIKPFPCLRSIASNIKYYHKIGVAGIRIQGNYVSYGGDLAVLKNYVWGKLLWDPTRDVDELVREFCDGYYGPAAEELIAYVNLLEDTVRGSTPVKADEFDPKFEKWLRPEIVAQAELLFIRALAKTNDKEPFYRRVREAQVGLEAHHLWKPGELVEQSGNLVRADFGADTLPRARDLIKYCRNASPREWGDGRAYRMSFLTMHGGPLPTLTAGPLTVKVAPLQGGKIRSVALGKTIAFDETRDVPNPGPRYYELVTHADNRVELEAELGVANWGSSTKQIAYRSVELTDQGVIRTSGSLKLAPGSRVNKNTPTVQTIFHCGDKPEQIVVEYLNADGIWRKSQVNANQPKAEIPLAKQLRVTRLDRNVIIHDTYRTDRSPTAVVEYLPQDKNRVGQILLTVEFGKITVGSDQPTTYVDREIRVTATNDE